MSESNLASDWKSRLRLERHDLGGRLYRLGEFLEAVMVNPELGHKTEISVEQLEPMRRQKEIMEQYLNVLDERIKLLEGK